MPARLQEELGAFVRARGGGDFTVVDAFDGSVSRCYTIRVTPGNGSLAVKRTRDGSSLTDEVSLLDAARVSDPTVPAVYATLEAGRTYVMEDVGQDTVWQAAGRIRGLPRDLPANLLDALTRYTSAAVTPFGDFHPGNAVLTTAGAVRLVDPRATEAAVDAVQDLGHWSCSTAAGVVEGLLPNPLRYARLLRLNVEMVALAAGPLPRRERRSFVDEVFSRARTELDTLRGSRWPRDRVTYWPALVAWGAMRWATRRRIDQPAGRAASR